MNISIKQALKAIARKVVTKSALANRLFRYLRPRLGLPMRRTIRSTKAVVYSIVSNTAIYDSRVMKQARTLRDAGYDVKLYCAIGDGLPLLHQVDGIELRRFRPFDSNHSLSDIERTCALRLFGDDRALVEASLYEVGWLGAEAETLRVEIKALSSSRARTSSEASVRGEIENRIEGLREKSKQLAEERRKTLVARKVYLYMYYFAVNFLKQKFPETPSFIHSHDIYPLPGAIELARRTGAKVIFDAHEIETERLPGFAPEEKAFVDRVERLWLSQTDKMVVCCDSAADFYAERFHRHRPQVVMNAPEMLPEGKSAFNLRLACGVGENIPLVVYTGGVGREARGLHFVVRALALLPSYHLAILGPRHGPNDLWLTEEASVANVAARVHLLPPVSSQQVVSAIRDADVGVCPIQDASLSYRYAMPNKLFEMAFAGIPLVVSELPEMANFVRSNDVGTTMDQTDPADIARAIRETYEQRKSLRKNKTQMMELLKKYAWPTQAEKLIQTYKS